MIGKPPKIKVFFKTEALLNEHKVRWDKKSNKQVSPAKIAEKKEAPKVPEEKPVIQSIVVDKTMESMKQFMELRGEIGPENVSIQNLTGNK